jgi:hypothetical protein
MAYPSLRQYFSGTAELYSTFIKQMKAENPQMNVSEVNYSKNRQGGGRNYSGKRGSSGTSNSNQGSSMNVDGDDFFYEKHEYLDLSSDQKNTLHLKCVKRGHVPDREEGEAIMEERGQGKPNFYYQVFAADHRLGAPLDYMSQKRKTRHD